MLSISKISLNTTKFSAILSVCLIKLSFFRSSFHCCCGQWPITVEILRRGTNYFISCLTSSSDQTPIKGTIYPTVFFVVYEILSIVVRKMIVCGCVAFAKHVGSMRLEAELLPQYWEQITHKYHERHLLVAECCGALAPYIPVSQGFILIMYESVLYTYESDLY